MKFNQTEILESVVAHQLKSEADLPNLSVGDTIDVHQRIIEGGKERTQVFQGVLIGMKGRGINRMITVRRIVANEGVERIFPCTPPRSPRSRSFATVTLVGPSCITCVIGLANHVVCVIAAAA